MSDDSSNSVIVAPRNSNKGWYIGLISLIAVVLLFFVAQAFAAALISEFVPILRHWSSAQRSEWLQNSITAQFFYELVADTLLLGGILGMLKLLHWQLPDIGLRRPAWRHLVVGVLAALPYYLIYFAALVLVGWLIPGLDIKQKQNVGFNNAQGGLQLALAFISLVVLPPLIEEITMRGFLYTGLKKWLPRVVAAVMVSALFGAAHLAEGGDAGPLWIAAIDTFVLSLVLVYLREKTGNLWAGIVLHAVKNGFAFLALFVLHLS